MHTKAYTNLSRTLSYCIPLGLSMERARKIAVGVARLTNNSFDVISVL
jgi:hypothetical protein